MSIDRIFELVIEGTALVLFVGLSVSLLYGILLLFRELKNGR